MEQVREKTGRLVANGDILQLNVQGLASLAVDVAGAMTATLVFEYTINGSNWYTMTVNVVGSSTTATGATAAGKWTGNVAGYSAVRIRCSAYTSGNPVMTLRAVLSGGSSGSSSSAGGDIQTAGADTESNTANAQTVNSRISGFNGTTWDRIRTGITAIGSVFTGFLNTLSWGIYHATPTARTDGQGGPLETDINGNLQINQATLSAGENLTTNRLNVEPIYSFLNITTNTTTVVKSGAGTFAGFTVNNNGFTTAGTITIYDNTAGSGTKLGTWTIPVQPPGTTLLATTFFPPALMLNASFTTGLTIVTATTAPACDITVLYR